MSELVGTATLTVTDSDTATAIGSGAVPAEKTTVGVHVELDHIRPSHPGTVVDARAELEMVEGRRLVFSVAATQESETVGRCTVIRAVVDRSAFEA